MSGLAQTFYIDPEQIIGGGGSIGIMASSIDLYFSAAASVEPISLHLREVEGGKVTNRIVPCSFVTVLAENVNTSATAATATNFAFPVPVFLEAGKEYAFVVEPGGNSPDYRLWVAELGEVDVVTEAVITRQPLAGVMLRTSNDKQFAEKPTKDIKFTLYRAKFTTNTTGSLYYENKQREIIDK